MVNQVLTSCVLLRLEPEHPLYSFILVDKQVGTAVEFPTLSTCDRTRKAIRRA